MSHSKRKWWEPVDNPTFSWTWEEMGVHDRIQIPEFRKVRFVIVTDNAQWWNWRYRYPVYRCISSSVVGARMRMKAKNFDKWRKQGVLFLEQSEFTEREMTEIIGRLSHCRDHLVFLLFGKQTWNWATFIGNEKRWNDRSGIDRHLVIKAHRPTLINYRPTLKDLNPFRRAEVFMKDNGCGKKIDWSI